jgi:hypothetical protein
VKKRGLRRQIRQHIEQICLRPTFLALSSIYGRENRHRIVQDLDQEYRFAPYCGDNTKACAAIYVEE